MNDKLLIFNKFTFKEVELPSPSEEKYEYTIERAVFNTNRDIKLVFAVLDNSWVFENTSDYDVFRKEVAVEGKKLFPGDIVTVKTSANESFYIVFKNNSNRIPVSLKFILDKKNKRYSIGTVSSNTICIQDNPLLKGQIATLELVSRASEQIWMISAGKNKPCYLNGRIILNPVPISYGDVINFFDIQIVFLGDVIAIEDSASSGNSIKVNLQPADEETLKWLASISVYSSEDRGDQIFSPAPRTFMEMPDTEIEIEGPPSPTKLNSRSLLSTIGPSFTMIIPMMIGALLFGSSMAMGLVVMGGSAILMAFWAAKSYFDQKKQNKKDEENRVARYKKYISEQEEKLQTLYDSETEMLRNLYPSAKNCVNYDKNSKYLWNRNPTQKDYHFLRLGTGEVKFSPTIRIPPEKFTLYDDELRQEPYRLKQQFSMLQNVPIGIWLNEMTLIGIVGEKMTGCLPVLRALIAQFAGNFSYTSMKLVLFSDGTNTFDRTLVESVKWIPHFWSDDMAIRFIGDDEESRKEVVEALLPVMKERWNLSKEKHKDIDDSEVQYIVISTKPEYITDSALGQYLLDVYSDIHVNTFLCAEDYSLLPNPCQYVIENSDQFRGAYSVSDMISDRHNIAFDSVEWTDLQHFSRVLSSIHVRTQQKQQEVPNVLSFLDMYGVNTIEELNIIERWRNNNSAVSLAAPIGMKEGSTLSLLDLHEKAHGPHGLVAGTTGSGKSETLMSLVLSLAVNFSPKEVSFLIVDFKGGGLANQFDNPQHRLPHLAGTITNLGGNQINRALISITSENIRRQRLLADAGVNDIYNYTKLYHNNEVKEALPHLIIVVDEFAELKKQFPEFMSELVSVAAIGRSLGVHLILATQKPSGVVDDKIESNSRFRICLKVQTEQDSKDMLKRPDAASITQQGRGYLRVGSDEVFEMFQSAWSGAVYTANHTSTHDDVAYLYTISGKTEITGNHSKMLRIEKDRLAWTDKLLRVTEDVFGASSVTTDQYLSDEKVVESINNRFYSRFADNNWSISKTPLNDSRLMDLVFVYNQCQKRHRGEEIDAHTVLGICSETGRILPEVSVNKQIDAICDMLNQEAEHNNLKLETKLWLPELADNIYLDEVRAMIRENDQGREGWTLSVCVGIYDDPAHQYQAPVIVDFASVGNYAIFGTISSGKSTFLQTLIYDLITNYSPSDVNIYALDFSSRMLECFKYAPHVGGILFENDLDTLENFFFFIEALLEERKNIIHGGNFTQYAESTPDHLPAVVIAIDQYGSFREKSDDQFENRLLQLIKEGSAYGIYFVITAGGYGTGNLPIKIGDVIKGKICLEMNDPYDYKSILNTSSKVAAPKENTKGRGVISIHGGTMEFQTAVAVKAANDFERSKSIADHMEVLSEEFAGTIVRAIPRVPQDPVYSEFIINPEVLALLNDKRSLPIGYLVQTGYPYALTLDRFFCFVLSGKSNSRRQNFMVLLMNIAKRKGGEVYVFGTGKGLLKKASEEINVKYISQDENLEPFCIDFKDELLRRNKKKHTLENQGLSNEEIFDQMSEETSVFIFIEDLVEFTQNLYTPKNGNVKVNGFFETFAEKGWYHQIFIFSGLDQSKSSTVKGRPFYESVTKDRNGIHFGGNVSSQQLLKYDYLSYKEQSMAQSDEIGLVSFGDNSSENGKIAVPDSRR